MSFKLLITSSNTSHNITFRYASETIEEAPLYLFERDFNSITSLRDDYSIPEYFSADAAHGTDLFRLLGERRRPDFKWLVIGPERSGSIFHIDPNQV